MGGRSATAGANRSAAGGVVSTSSLGTGTSTPPSPARGQGNPQPQAQSTDGGVLAGLTITSGTVLPMRPKVAGRGRAANPMNAEIAAFLTQSLTDENASRVHIGDLNALNREVKNTVDKWITANGGKEKVNVSYVELPDQTAKLPKAQRDKNFKVRAYYAYRVAPKPAAAAS